jgi:hypothetical protein
VLVTQLRTGVFPKLDAVAESFMRSIIDRENLDPIRPDELYLRQTNFRQRLFSGAALSVASVQIEDEDGIVFAADLDRLAGFGALVEPGRLTRSRYRTAVGWSYSANRRRSTCMCVLEQISDGKVSAGAAGAHFFHNECLGESYEAVMIRTPDLQYKCGRSTEREGWLLKIKRFEDDESVVLETYEGLSNLNPAERDAFGRTKRSSCKEIKVGRGELGGFVVRVMSTGVEFRVDTTTCSVGSAV